MPRTPNRKNVALRETVHGYCAETKTQSRQPEFRRRNWLVPCRQAALS